VRFEKYITFIAQISSLLRKTADGVNKTTEMKDCWTIFSENNCECNKKYGFEQSLVELIGFICNDIPKFGYSHPPNDYDHAPLHLYTSYIDTLYKKSLTCLINVARYRLGIVESNTTAPKDFLGYVSYLRKERRADKELNQFVSGLSFPAAIKNDLLSVLQ